MALRLSDHGDQNLTRFQVVWLPSNAVPEQTYRSSLTQIIYKTGRKYVFCYKWHHSRISLCISQTGTTQTAGARNKGGNFIGQLCISVVPYCTFWFIDCCRSCTDVLFVEKRNEIVQFRNIVRLLSQTSVAENTNANLFIKVVIS